MTEIYILSIIGAVALTIWIENILIFLVDKFIWKYMEKDEKKMMNRQQDRKG